MRRFLGRFAPQRIQRSESSRSTSPIFSTAVAVSVGLIVLLDMLTDLPLFNGVAPLLIEYGLIIAVFALMLGVLNVVSVHLQRVRHQASGWIYSLLLLVTTIFLIAVGLISGPQGLIIEWSFTNILLPLQSAFFSLLAFFLLSIAYRAMRINSIESLLFVGSAVIIILGATPLGRLLGNTFVELKEFLLAVPATAGARGLLFGIALGTVVTGLRLIFDGRRYFK